MARYFAAASALLTFASPVSADWHEAQSQHFVVYADDSEKDVREFAELLERYHAAMSLLTGQEVAVPSPSNRVTIFAVGNEREIRRLLGDGADNVAGFYLPRAGGSRAFVPDVRTSSRETPFSFIVLLHEYAHHFLMSSQRHAMPRWLNEGAAEFFASSRFARDGSLQIGRPAYHRAGELAYAKDVSVEELLDHELYEENRGRRYDAFYGRSWALYHYLRFDEERSDQLSRYATAITQGMPPRAAAESAFGDLDELERDLDRYLRKRRMTTFDFKPGTFETGEITVRRVSEGMDEAMPLRIRSQRGVDREQALELLPDVREVAARYPNDADVLAVLAEAEHDAGNDAEAIAAADRAIAINPTTKNAYVQKGLSLFRIAFDAEEDEIDAAYAAAMEPFQKLNALENDHPLPLIFYYRSFTERGEEPNENARHALERASILAPFDQGLTMNAANMLASEGKIALATSYLESLATNPHGGGLAEEARNMIEAMKTVDEGTRFSNSRAWREPDPETLSDDPDASTSEDGEGSDDSPTEPESSEPSV
ncbi:DUF1570 domain-containing protein [Pelagerythrobacter sp.]|uniref:DUF1570 domain-containing protein n=1 Tax=Pelagerythrobacter sp. TaxID=2800702 RepID=UPI0035AE869B